MLSAAVRDLHRCHPNVIQLADSGCTEIIQCEYPLVHRSNREPWHFIHGFHKSLSEKLKIDVQPTDFKGGHLFVSGRETLDVASSGNHKDPHSVLDPAFGVLGQVERVKSPQYRPEIETTDTPIGGLLVRRDVMLEANRALAYEQCNNLREGELICAASQRLELRVGVTSASKQNG